MTAILDPITDSLIDLALAEDLAAGDVTTEACVLPEARGSGRLVAREPCVLSGTSVAREVFRRVDPDTTWSVAREEGALLQAGDTVARVEGRLASLLKAERTALNFLRHLCGVATQTRRFVEAAAHGGAATVRVVDTRKTTPGMRSLEKAAVRAGGGVNHRFHLGDGVLIKDNHLIAAGGITAALERARAHAHHLLRLEVEVEDLAGLQEALDAGADAVLLDNMSPAEVALAVRLAAGRVLLEASGGIDLRTIAGYAATGVDLISVGALTHGAVDADLALDLDQA